MMAAKIAIVEAAEDTGSLRARDAIATDAY